MSHIEQIAAALDASFTAFGEIVTWPGVSEPVRVIFPPESNGDGILQTGRNRVITPRGILHVRVAEVEAPERDAIVTTLTGETFRLLARPGLIKGGHVWQCQVAKVEP